MPIIPVTEFSTYIDRFIRRGQSGASDSIFPRFMEDQGIFTFPVFPDGLHWQFGAMSVASFTATSPTVEVGDTVVVGTALRYYHAISAAHSDPLSRNLRIRIRDSVTGAIVELEADDVPADRPVTIGRPVVLGERHQLRAVVDALAATETITLRTYAVAIGLGVPLPAL